MENGTHIKRYRYRRHRRHRHRRRRRRRRRFLQNRTEKGLETRKQFINVIQCTSRRSVLQHCPWLKCLIRQQGIQKSSSQRYIAKNI